MSASVRRSIALPIFLLVVASVLVATAVSFAVTFSGPPPMEPPRELDRIAGALATGTTLSGRGQALAVRQQATAPLPQEGERPRPEQAGDLARELGVPASAVVVHATRQPPRMADALVPSFTVAARIGDRWRVMQTAPRPRFTQWHLRTLVAMLLAILVLCGPAWWLARALSRPLRQLADAADQARAGAALPPLPGGGGREVRDLSRAVATMHARLASHAEARTAMLAGIAHDLGTPLSRLSFWAEQLPDAARERAAADIAEMRGMIADTLRFTRDDLAERVQARVELGSLLDSLGEDMAATGTPVSVEPGPRAVINGDVRTLRRLFANLIENAVRYGGDARVGWTITGRLVEVHVDDRGPGIDPGAAERLFQPFVRGEPSRNRATGGTGLGLAIVRSVAVRHGGAATLENRADGPGARARVTLPLAG